MPRIPKTGFVRHRLFRVYSRRITTGRDIKALASEPQAVDTLDCEEFRHDTEVKKSRFVTWAWPVDSVDQALTCIGQRSDPSASHNCFAYKVGGQYRSSDDGEPGGTAGRPILSAVEGEGLDQVCVLVTRYFGGIKLGTGGLVRAYGGAARECLRRAPKRPVIERVEVRVLVPFDALGLVYQAAETVKAQVLDQEYGVQEGNLTVRVSVNGKHADLLCDTLRELSNGRLTPEVFKQSE